MKKIMQLLLLGAGVFLCGCKDSAVIWAEDIKSPDGQWIASASTEQFGGMGTASIQTAVYLKRGGSNRKIQIIGISHGAAYSPGITNIDMRWVDSSHLAVIYRDHNAVIDFQAIRCGGVDISLVEEMPVSSGGADLR